jgi:hypothetical protein
MSQTAFTRLKTSDLNTLASTTLGNLRPYQIEQVAQFLARVLWGNATTTLGVTAALGEGSMSDIGNQPTIAQIVTLMGSNDP